MTRFRFVPEPGAPQSEAGDPAVQLAVATSRRSAALGGEARRGTPQSAAFGAMIAGLRGDRGLDRAGLAAAAGLNPIYLGMLERGLLAPEEVPPVVVAKLALGLGHRLDELLLTPHEIDQEPDDEVEVGDRETRLYLGYRTLGPWVESQLEGADSPAVPVSIRFPEFLVRSPDGTWRVGGGQMSNSPIALSGTDDYVWHVVRRQAADPGWWVHAVVSTPDGGRPVPGVGMELRVGSRRPMAVSDAEGRLRFEGVDPSDIEPLAFSVL
jgi:hypothetical protein